jgi:cytochrome P450
MQVFMSVMGIPPDDVQLVDIWVRTALKGHDRSASAPDQVAGATASMALRSYFSGLQLEMSKRADAGPPSVLEAMKECTRPTESASAMSSFEAVNTAIQFALGGYLSTQFLIASGVYTLLRNRDQWEILCGNRGLLDRAVTEMLRYEAPFQIADRWVADKTELNGVTLTKGTKIAVVYGSANRDAEIFADPDRFLIDRESSDEVFGFGNGIHRCIGAPLAPVVTRIALEALLDHYPFARLGPAGPWSTDPYFRSLSQLTLLLS